MKILIVHNDYGRYSGEEAMVDRMIADFGSMGHRVEVLRHTTMYSRDTLPGKIRGFFAGIYSFSGCQMMRKALRTFNPDLVHIHNLYPFISPAVLHICRRKGYPVAMTVHNYRLICPTGLFLRNNRPCEDCFSKGKELNCIFHNCEENIFRSLGYALRNIVARLTRAYIDGVNFFCCLTEFQKKKLIQAGFDSKKIYVFNNYFDYIEPEGEPTSEAGSYIGYVGRLSPEKGYDLLLDVAKRHPEIKFHFAGTVRDKKEVEFPDNVIFCGQLNSRQLARFYADSRFIVIPSRCYEGFTTVMLEASSHKKPCITPKHGAFPELMVDKKTGSKCGLLFNPSDATDLEHNILTLWNDPALCSQLGNAAWQKYQTCYTKQKIMKDWSGFLSSIQKH